MKKLFFITLLLSNCLLLVGQQNQKDDPIGENFFPPELIMEYQNEIGLTADQETMIVNQMKEAQNGFIDLNWKMKKLSDKLISIVSQDRIDEDEATNQLKTMLEVENQIKVRQIALMVRIKNSLNSNQINMLKELRQRSGR